MISTGLVRLAGDANGDGVVNSQDIAVTGSNWLHTVTPGTNGDVNFDGVVNSQDISMIGSNWLHTLPSGGSVPVPEPNTAVLAAVATIFAMFCCGLAHMRDCSRSERMSGRRAYQVRRELQ